VPKSQYEIFLDGDDSVIAINRKYLHLMDFNFSKVGLTTKIEQMQDDMYKVQFCQCSMVETPAGPRMIRNPLRAITRTMFSTQDYDGTGWHRYLKTVAECELACNRGVPMMQAFAQAMINQLQGYKSLDPDGMPADLAQRMKWERDPGPYAVTSSARESFSRAFGITPDEQVDWEDWLSSKNYIQQLDNIAGRREGAQAFSFHTVERFVGKNPYA